jgi:hypothetical protein
MCSIGTCKYCPHGIIKNEYADSDELIKNIYPVICNLDDPETRKNVTYRLNHECHHVTL